MGQDFGSSVGDYFLIKFSSWMWFSRVSTLPKLVLSGYSQCCMYVFCQHIHNNIHTYIMHSWIKIHFSFSFIIIFCWHITLFCRVMLPFLQYIVNIKQKVYILSISPLSYPSWKNFALAFLFSSLSRWNLIPLWVYFSLGAVLVDCFIPVYFWFESPR